MSATIDAKLYKLLYRHRKIHLHECRKAEYMGKVIQYTNYSYSRFFFNENEKIIDEFIKRIENQVVITAGAGCRQGKTVKGKIHSYGIFWISC